MSREGSARVHEVSADNSDGLVGHAIGRVEHTMSSQDRKTAKGKFRASVVMPKSVCLAGHACGDSIVAITLCEDAKVVLPHGVGVMREAGHQRRRAEAGAASRCGWNVRSHDSAASAVVYLMRSIVAKNGWC